MTRSAKTFYPWLIWSLGSLFLFYKYVLQVAPSVMVEHLMSAFHLNGAQLGNLVAFYFYAYVIMQIPAGILLDYYSPRYLISLSILLCAAGAFLFGHSTTVPMAITGRVLIGIGGAFSAIGTLKLVTNWFPPKMFALVGGLMLSMGMLGAVGGEAPLAELVKLLGWRPSLIYNAVFGIIFAFIFWLIVRDNNSPSTTTSAKRTPLLSSIKLVMKNPQAWLVALYSGLAFAPIPAFAGLWGVPYIAQSYGLSHTDAAALVSLIFIGFAVGSPVGGWLSDRIGKRKPILVYSTAVSLVLVCIIIYDTQLPYWLFESLLLCFGFSISFFFSSFALIKEICSIGAAATAIGFINMFNALGGAISEPAIGQLLDSGWSGKMLHGARVFSAHDYKWALVLLPASLLLALIVGCLLPESHCQQR